jgi:hypothetical protein
MGYFTYIMLRILVFLSDLTIFVNRYVPPAMQKYQCRKMSIVTL